MSAGRASCVSAPLVEARRDGRLGEREIASLERHLAGCAECRELERSLDALGAALKASEERSISPLEHQRARLALLRTASATSRRPPHAGVRSLGAHRAVATLLAAAIAAVAVLAIRGAPQAPPTARRLAGLVTHAADATRPFETLITGSADARFERTREGHVDRVALTDGTIHLHVRKLGADERFVVATTDAEVEVRGTVFHVEARDGYVARVAVSEGKVEVRHHGGVWLLPAGGSWEPVSMGNPVGVPQPPPVMAVASHARAVEGASRAAPSSRPLAFGNPVGVPQAPPVTKVDGDQKTAGVTGPPRREQASTAFRSAVDALGSGDYAAARARLDAFRDANPADDRADLAAFLTIVSLQRAGRRVEAQAAARRYLELYPRGDRRREVERVAFGR